MLNEDADLEVRVKRVSLRPGLSVAESKGGGVGGCGFIKNLLALRPGGGVCIRSSLLLGPDEAPGRVRL